MAVDANGNPIDPNAPSATGGSGLGDLLAGISGANISRPAIGAGIANGQALAGLRTAQTEEAMTKAMQAREQMAAKAQLEDSITQMKGPDGNPTYTPSQAHAVALGLQAGGGNFEQLVAGLKGGNQVQAQGVLGDPSKIGTPQATAAGQVMEGKPAGLQTVPEAYAVPAGAPQPNVQLSPIGTANVNEKAALANAANQRASNSTGQMDPELAGIVADFGRTNPAIYQNLRSTTMGGGPMIIAADIAQNGTGPAQLRAASWLARKAAGMSQPQPAPGPAQPPGSVTPDNPNGAVGRPGNPPLTAEDTAPALPPGVAPHPSVAAPGQLAVHPLQPGQEEHNDTQNTAALTTPPAPGVSKAEQVRIRNDAASGATAKQVTNINTAMAHARLLDMVADQTGNGDIVPANTVGMLYKRLSGNPIPNNLATIVSFLGREAVRSTVTAGAGTEEERDLQLPTGSSPAQMHGVANTIRSLLAPQLDGLDKRALRGGADIRGLLSPETQQENAAMLGANRDMARNGWHVAGETTTPAAPAALPSYPDEPSALAAGHKIGDRVMVGGKIGTLQ